MERLALAIVELSDSFDHYEHEDNSEPAELDFEETMELLSTDEGMAKLAAFIGDVAENI